MGYIINPTEVKGWIQEVRARLSEWEEKYQAALKIIMEFTENEELVGYSYNKMKNQLGVYHQLAVHGAGEAKERIEGDLSILESSIGTKNLEEDILLEKINKLKEECRRCEDYIERLVALSRLSIFGLVSYFVEPIIEENRRFLEQMEEEIRLLEECVERIYEINDSTAGLFISASDWFAAVYNAMRDLQVTISGEGTMSSGSWKAMLLDSFEEEFGKLTDIEELYDKYLTEEIFKSINERWDIEKVAELCGYESKEKFFEGLRFFMMNANITNEVSICMFLSYLGVESAYGAAVMERRTDFSDVKYTFNTRGGGLSQLTSATGKEYIKHLTKTLPEGELKKRAEELLKGYSEDGNRNNVGDVAEFIGQNFPIESATWFWAVCEKATYYTDPTLEKRDRVNMSLNEFVQHFEDKNLNNVYLAVQYYVNGMQWSTRRTQIICLMEKECEFKDGNIYLKDEDGILHDEPAPNHWKERKEDWDRIKVNIEK